MQILVFIYTQNKSDQTKHEMYEIVKVNVFFVNCIFFYNDPNFSD